MVGKTDCEPLPDAAARPGDQDAFIFYVSQVPEYPFYSSTSVA